MVLAVNWPPQAPAPGQATHSSSCSSESGMAPAECLPTASNTSTTVTSLPWNLPGHDRAAIEEHRRHVQPQHRHHHAGQALVAARDADQRVIAMAAHGQLDGIGDHFARHERGLHALVPHGDAVGHRDGAEFARRAAGLLHAALGRIAPGASARCCRARPRSSRRRRRRRDGGSPHRSAPSRNNRSDAARVPALR